MEVGDKKMPSSEAVCNESTGSAAATATASMSSLNGEVSVSMSFSVNNALNAEKGLQERRYRDGYMDGRGSFYRAKDRQQTSHTDNDNYSRFVYGNASQHTPPRFLGHSKQQPLPPFTNSHLNPFNNFYPQMNGHLVPTEYFSPPLLQGYTIPAGCYADPYYTETPFSPAPCFGVTEGEVPYAPQTPQQTPSIDNFPLPELAGLLQAIRKQIEYYFSIDNLVKDEFLRTNMDENGWVSIDLIANFNRVKGMTRDVSLILKALSSSRVIEVQVSKSRFINLEIQENKIRRRGDWKTWILPSKRTSEEN